MDATTVNPETHDQEAELALLGALVPHLGDRAAIDVGSEHGALAASLRDAGADPMWLVEPFPASAAILRERFADDDGVHVLELAAGATDTTAELHLAHDEGGQSLDAFHALRPGESGPGLRWEGSVQVEVRSLSSLAAAGEIPARVGLLKIDAEGGDADVLRGAGELSAELVMVEYWGDLPDTVGPCPYSLDEITALVAPLGPARFIYVHHGPHHVNVGRWDRADVEPGAWGNLIFVADPLVEPAEAALPALDRALRTRNEQVTAEQATAATERLALINEMSSERSRRR